LRSSGTKNALPVCHNQLLRDRFHAETGSNAPRGDKMTPNPDAGNFSIDFVAEKRENLK